MMRGRGEDDTKGKVRHLTTLEFSNPLPNPKRLYPPSVRMFGVGTQSPCHIDHATLLVLVGDKSCFSMASGVKGIPA